jgi:hypothetical protein
MPNAGVRRGNQVVATDATSPPSMKVIGDLTRRPVALDSHGGLGQQRQSGRFTHGGFVSRRRERTHPRPKRFLPVGQIHAGYSFDATSMVPRGNSTSRRSDAREF